MLRRAAVFCALSFASAAFAQHTAPQIESPSVSGRLVVVYRDAQVPATAHVLAHSAGARSEAHLDHLGISILNVAQQDEASATAQLRARPEVAAVLHDRAVSGHAMPLRPAVLAPDDSPAPMPRPIRAVALAPKANPAATVPAAPLGRSGVMILSFPTPVDNAYANNLGWAVRAAGGFGDNIIGGSATGPWNTSRGAGVRIAILDSGIDAHHPDLAPNLAVNLSEVDQAALPSPCDDGSPQDQTGHGTWAASLAVAAIGNGTGSLIGVAPQATLLNIKVLQRMPAASGADQTAKCEAGQTGGLLSWVLSGINDAIAQHANIISLSLGSLVDLTTGDGAGWKASFDRVTYAATQAGAVIVAAAGNDGLDLSSGHFAELPAQARDVLPVTASTNPACAENLTPGATCQPGPVTRPYYSNHGANLNAIAAPGGSYPAPADPTGTASSGWIYGACSSGLTTSQDGLPANGKSFGCFNLGHTQYVQAMGTSASAPLVAGAAAILHAAHPNWTAEQLIAVLRSTATQTGSMTEPLLNLPAAIAHP